jgi:hypothetical protein
VISFRYHLVSIVAVFLALALGIVVGTTLLNGPVTNNLRDQVNSLKHQRGDLDNRLKQLQGEVDDAGQFASTYGSQLVSGTLKDTGVLLIALPGASPTEEDGIAQQVQNAGGKIAGRIGLTNDYVDQRRASSILSLATGPARPIWLTLPETSDAGQVGGALLAAVLTGGGQHSDLTQVLSGFSELHMVTTDGNAVDPATAVIVVGNGTLPKADYAGGVELALITQLQKYKASIVVAGDAGSATGGGIVALVRGSDVRTTVSSVDNADTAAGEVSTVLTLAATQKQQVGHYGTASGADALFPSPAK